MSTILIIGCKGCGRNLKLFEPMLIERLSRGHGCHFCGGDLDVPAHIRAEANKGASKGVERGRCLGCLRPLRPKTQSATWSCYVCGAKMLPPASNDAVCRAGPAPGSDAADWRSVADMCRPLDGLPAWCLRIRAMLLQRAHRGEVAAHEVQTLVEEAASIARWRPTGKRQVLPVAASTLAHTLAPALYLDFAPPTLKNEQDDPVHWTVSIPDVTKADPAMALPGEQLWGTAIRREKRSQAIRQVGDAMSSFLEIWDDEPRSYDPDSVIARPALHFRALVHIYAKRVRGGLAVRPMIQVLGIDDGALRDFDHESLTRFYKQLGRLKPLMQRYLKLHALFGPMLRPQLMSIHRDAIAARLDTFGFPANAAEEFIIGARGNLDSFKRLVGLHS